MVDCFIVDITAIFADIGPSPWRDAFAPSNWANWALVIVGGIAGYFAWRTLRAIKRQADLMAQTLVETQKAADATRDSVTDASNTAIRQLRAYVGAHQIGVMGIDDDSAFGVGFAFVNHGQTPALNFNLRGAVHLLPYPLPEDFVIPSPPKKPQQDGVIFPDETNPMTGWVWESATQRLKPTEKLELFSRSTTREFYAHGVATYTDIFNIARTTEFCFVLNPSSVVRDERGDILRGKDGKIQFQWAPVPYRNSVQ